MADYYTQFSVGVELMNDAEKEWCIRALKDFSSLMELHQLEDHEGEELELFERLSREYPQALEQARGNDWSILEFNGSITKAHEATAVAHLSITSDEVGNVDQVATFLQTFLLKLRPKDALAFTWANTCNKMREDGFDGGAMFVTTTDIKFISAFQWCEERWSEFRNGGSCRACNIEAELGTEEVPHPIDPRIHTCEPMKDET